MARVTTCPHCGKPRDGADPFCSGCGTRYNNAVPQPAAHGGAWRLLGWAGVAVLVVVVLIAYGGGAPSGASPPAPTPEPTATPAPTPFPFAFTVNAARTVTALGDGETPSRGNVFLIVDLTIRNQGDSARSYNPFYFKLKSPAHYVYDPSFVSAPNALTAGTLQPGDEVRGTLTFDAPAAAHPEAFVLVFQPPSLFGDVASVTIPLP